MVPFYQVVSPLTLTSFVVDLICSAKVLVTVRFAVRMSRILSARRSDYRRNVLGDRCGKLIEFLSCGKGLTPTEMRGILLDDTSHPKIIESTIHWDLDKGYLSQPRRSIETSIRVYQSHFGFSLGL